MEIFAIISLVAGQERHEKATGYARVAQLVEHHLAKVGVAGSSPVSRSSMKVSKVFNYKALEIFFYLRLKERTCINLHKFMTIFLFLKYPFCKDCQRNCST